MLRGHPGTRRAPPVHPALAAGERPHRPVPARLTAPRGRRPRPPVTAARLLRPQPRGARLRRAAARPLHPRRRRPRLRRPAGPGAGRTEGARQVLDARHPVRRPRPPRAPVRQGRARRHPQGPRIPHLAAPRQGTAARRLGRRTRRPVAGPGRARDAAARRIPHLVGHRPPDRVLRPPGRSLRPVPTGHLGTAVHLSLVRTRRHRRPLRLLLRRPARPRAHDTPRPRTPHARLTRAHVHIPNDRLPQ
ncbi:hypothetical protein SGPA1_12189 [Streptomyces misionensis JCM 4497]